MSLIRTAGVILLAVLSLPLPGVAQELRIALRSEPTSLDPQFQNLASNNQIANHLFEALVARSDKQLAIPGLAVSWKAVGDTVWEFKLRPDVKFHDGSPFTARDVVFTFARAAKVPNSPSPFTSITRQITKLETVDPLTLRIHTAAPAPLLPLDLSGLPILSHIAAGGGAPEGRTTVELERGDGLVGTGPFKFVAWRRGTELVVARNENYWGEKPAWSRVTFRPIGSGAARLGALLAGEFDLIEDPPLAELAFLRKDARVALAETVTNRLVFIALDHFAEPSPGIPDAGGKNPLKDRRVRQALSQAIDRKSVTEKTMEGLGVPAGDFLPWPAFGTTRTVQPDKFDPAGARKLLAEAGYPNGFSLALGSPNGRYLFDLKVAQAVAAMWKAVGIRADVDAAAPAAFFKNRDEYRYSAYLSGWTADSGEMSNPLRALVATPNREKGMGGTNRGRYTNLALDAKLEEALRTVDDKRRETLLQEAARFAIADDAVLPLHFELAVWAMRRDLFYPGRTDQATLAQFIRPRPASR